ncbi:hypothetical protein BVRB_9g205800 isoform B [Beta vulgaris subsp. vulgaris]|nr:hypothetical protein BVRB_9g205800 isoform B [Beta vulgaris subsp. vulgaris]
MADSAMDFDDSLDFELDDPPLVATKKRKKVIGLDDLFNDHKKEQLKKKKEKSRGVKGPKVVDSDDDDVNETANKLSEVLDDFKKTICEVDGHDGGLNDVGQEDVTWSWGLQVFGTQRTPLPLVVPQLEECLLLQNSLSDELKVLLDHSSQMGETFLEGLLLNGWLSKLIMICGYLEQPIAKWTLNLLFYSSEELLMASACDFWCAILCNKTGAPAVKVEWLPSFLDLNRALESYGFQLHLSTINLTPVESTPDSSDRRGPPTNIRAWIKFAEACCQVRSYMILSTQEVEEFIGILICLFLERQLLGLSGALHNCLRSAINFFEEKEWNRSCEEVVKSIADRIPVDLSCLRAVECISGADTRSKQLRSAVAYRFLTICYAELQLTSGKDVLKFLVSINMKDKTCNLFKIYLCLVLAENWLLFGSETKTFVNELWSSFIRKCSIQISNTDFRPCAQEIRNRASYLLQSMSRN